MYSPYLNDLARIHTNDLVTEARHAQRCREVSGPTVMQRLAARWRRPSAGADTRRPTHSAVVGRHA
ncbi:MAG: hypothetical protein QOG53_604 [Frankiales bacterium]|jgi:hypothetical protein|nr:hypothetical protein [Frankiales bacterium]